MPYAEDTVNIRSGTLGKSTRFLGLPKDYRSLQTLAFNRALSCYRTVRDARALPMQKVKKTSIACLP
jgi:hypothetical protein